jgi:uncharacterized protein YecT (DUF1311 family)
VGAEYPVRRLDQGFFTIDCNDNNMGHRDKRDDSLYGSAAVKHVQATWLQFRNAECTLEESHYKGASISPLIYGECEITLTTQRLQQVLEAIAGVPHAGP